MFVLRQIPLFLVEPVPPRPRILVVLQRIDVFIEAAHAHLRPSDAGRNQVGVGTGMPRFEGSVRDTRAFFLSEGPLGGTRLNLIGQGVIPARIGMIHPAFRVAYVRPQLRPYPIRSGPGLCLPPVQRIGTWARLKSTLLLTRVVGERSPHRFSEAITAPHKVFCRVRPGAW